MTETIYERRFLLIDETLCDEKGEPILSSCHGAKIMRPYPISMTGICMGVGRGESGEMETCGAIKLEPSIEAHFRDEG